MIAARQAVNLTFSTVVGVFDFHRGQGAHGYTHYLFHRTTKMVRELSLTARCPSSKLR